MRRSLPRGALSAKLAGRPDIQGELELEAGFPKGVFNVVTSSDPVTAGEMLVTDPRVDLITFTGSTGLGKRIMEKGGPTLKRLFLGLGGKSANIANIASCAPSSSLWISCDAAQEANRERL
jgi:hypothetical protein